MGQSLNLGYPFFLCGHSGPSSREVAIGPRLMRPEPGRIDSFPAGSDPTLRRVGDQESYCNFVGRTYLPPETYTGLQPMTAYRYWDRVWQTNEGRAAWA